MAEGDSRPFLKTWLTVKIISSIIGIVMVILFVGMMLMGFGWSLTYTSGFKSGSVSDEEANKFIEECQYMKEKNIFTFDNFKNRFPTLDNTHYYDMLNITPTLSNVQKILTF